MKACDVKRFRGLLTALSEQKGKMLSEAQFDLWWSSVCDMTIEDFGRAVQANFRLGDRFMPSPGELRALVEGSNQDRAALAFNRVMGAIGSAGTYASVVFDDPAIQATIASMGGWVAFGQREQDDFCRKEFERIYRAFAQRIAVDGPRAAAGIPRVLVGICEAQNGNAGFGSQPPKFIGDESKARAWQAQLEGGPAVPVAVRQLEGGKAA